MHFNTDLTFEFSYYFIALSGLNFLNDMPDKQEHENSLIARFNARDTEAFVSVYRQLFTELHAYAARLYRDTVIHPEDAVQDVFCSLLENRGNHFERLADIRAFLYTAVRNRYKSFLEHEKVADRYREHVETEADLTTENAENELRHLLQSGIALLPENQAQVLNLYIEGYEPEEIAERLQISTRTVYNTKSLAVQALKEKFAAR